ncbi:MAG: DNA methyltransferase [Acidobacteriaceae bacterium]
MAIICDPTYRAYQVEPHPKDCNIFGARASAISDTDFPSQMATKNNALYCGDNLFILRDRIANESVDLIYLDPPFNSKRDYNLIFREHGGKKATSQELVFGDTWVWSETADHACRELIESGGKAIAEVIRAFRSFLGTSDMMAYIAMMAPRLVELHRVLKETGSIYLHCDPTASHYLKILMDAIFGAENFRNEIVWKRSHAHSDAKQGAQHFGRITDSLLFYGKGPVSTWNPLYLPYDEEYIERDYRRIDERGRRYRIDNLQGPGGAEKGNPRYEVMGVTRYWRYSKEKMQQLIAEGRVIQTRPGAVPQYKRYLDEMPGVPVQNLWTDLAPLNNRSKEVLGYPTQKPEALLDRILKASSNAGDVVLDPFCGCGTAVEVAQQLNRRWIGVDVTHLSLAIIKQRLERGFGHEIFKTISVIGEPVTEEEALALAARDKFGFQCWAVGRIGAPPIEHKKGADRGIDGRIYFHDDFGTPKHIIISVKAGDHIGPAFVRELRGVVDREKAEMGILVCVKEPTSEMKKEAAQLGFYKSIGGNFPRLQIITLKDIFANKPLNVPVKRINPYERKGPQSVRPVAEQLRLLP